MVKSLSVDKVYFSSVWEDYLSLQQGLSPQASDVVLSVASSGDNIFNFLTDNVSKIYAVDINPAQLSLAKLKLELLRRCDPQKVLDLLTGNGDKTENKHFVETIISSDKNLKKYLSAYNFENGVDNIGEFERRVVPPVAYCVKQFFKEADFVHANEGKKANVWLSGLPIAFSFKRTYKFLIPDFPYQHININMGKSLQKSLKNFLSHNDFRGNWYLQKIYFGRYQTLPPFLRPDNFKTVKNNADRITFVDKDILSFLKQSKDGSVDKINLSDIFDWCSEEDYAATLREAHRVLSPNGRIFYWELFVSRELPEELKSSFKSLKRESAAIHQRDNVPIYHRIVILEK